MCKQGEYPGVPKPGKQHARGGGALQCLWQFSNKTWTPSALTSNTSPAHTARSASSSSLTLSPEDSINCNSSSLSLSPEDSINCNSSSLSPEDAGMLTGWRSSSNSTGVPAISHCSLHTPSACSPAVCSAVYSSANDNWRMALRTACVSDLPRPAKSD